MLALLRICVIGIVMGGIPLMAAAFPLPPVADNQDAVRLPGRAEPVAAPSAQVLIVDWDDQHQSWLVIEPGEGVSRLAWILTFVRQDPIVAYAGTAFLDREGALHFDGREARLVYFEDAATRTYSWIPDSFAVREDRVDIMDDHGTTGVGKVSSRYDLANTLMDYLRERNWVLGYLNGVF